MQIHIQRGEENLGAFSLDETSQYLSEGSLLKTDLAWHEGLDECKPLGQLHQELLSEAETMVAEETEGETQPTTPAPDRYKKEELLGEGGMGQVWRAYDSQLQRSVALKMVSGGRALDTLTREVSHISTQITQLSSRLILFFPPNKIIGFY